MSAKDLFKSRNATSEALRITTLAKDPFESRIATAEAYRMVDRRFTLSQRYAAARRIRYEIQ